MRKDQVDLANAVVWIPDSKTPTGVGEVPLTDLAVEAFVRPALAGWTRAVVVSERSESARLPGELQEDLAHNVGTRGRSVLPDLRSALDICNPFKRGRRGRRVGDPASAAK